MLCTHNNLVACYLRWPAGYKMTSGQAKGHTASLERARGHTSPVLSKVTQIITLIFNPDVNNGLLVVCPCTTCHIYNNIYIFISHDIKKTDLLVTTTGTNLRSPCWPLCVAPTRSPILAERPCWGPPYQDILGTHLVCDLDRPADQSLTATNCKGEGGGANAQALP